MLKKIDFYISSLSSGGAEHVLKNLAEYFVSKGFETSITSLEKRPQFYDIDKSVKIYKVNNTECGKFMGAVKDFIFLNRRFRSEKNAVSVSFLSRCNLLLLISSIFCKNKLIVCDRNNPIKEHSKFVFLGSCIIYMFADKIVVQTHKIKNLYPSFLQKKIAVIENPIDMQRLSAQIEDVQNKEEKVIISAGRLEKQKDFFTLIQAFGKSNAIVSGWRLKIFGKGVMKAELEQYINNLGLQEYVELCGTTPVLFREMKESQIFVLSSFYEGFPNVLCEAMYAGLPSIATDCVSGPSELIIDGENGFLVPIQDVESMKEKINFLISNKELRNTMGDKAHQSVHYLSLDQIADIWLNEICSI